MSSKEDMWEYSLLDMSQNLREIDQELQGGYMSIFLIRYALKAWGSSHELQRRYMSIFFIKYVLKSYGNRPGAPRRILYEYIPY